VTSCILVLPRSAAYDEKEESTGNEMKSAAEETFCKLATSFAGI